MDIIQVLEPNIADQIAAGEVVNRPASVVKELLENAVDAGAKNITLVIVDAGQTLVQVIDDGKGMSPKDAKMAFKRHATSKIRSAEDLWQLNTFGFRGEALASIASVAQVELKTRREEDELGCLIDVNGGVLFDPVPTHCNKGTSITVKNLFFNTPARRKFLKSAGYERQVLILEFERVAMANPEIGFVFQSENEPQPLVLRPSSLRERVGAIIKRNIDKSLLPVGLKTEEVSIKGWISAPSQSGGNSTKNSHFFVNGRFMRNMLLQKSVAQAYGKLLPAGQFPYFYLFIDIDPAQIDVNIHPTKTEIKFQNDSFIWQLVNSSVRKALGGAALEPAIDFSNPVVDVPTYNPNVDFENIEMPKQSSASGYNPFKKVGSSGFSPAKGFDPEVAIFDETLVKGYYKNNAFNEVANDFFQGGDSNFGELEIEYINENPNEQLSIEIGSSMNNYDVMQLGGGYVATAVENGIAIIDYRRAIEKITFEKIINAISTDGFASQMEVIPQQVEMSQSDASLIISVAPELIKFGFDISDMGQGVVALYSMPATLNTKIDAKTLLEEIVEELESGAKVDQFFVKKMSNAIAKSIARQKIERLTDEQMQSVVSQLFECSQPLFTDSGQIVVTIINKDEIEKRFKRR